MYYFNFQKDLNDPKCPIIILQQLPKNNFSIATLNELFESKPVEMSLYGLKDYSKLTNVVNIYFVICSLYFLLGYR